MNLKIILYKFSLVYMYIVLVPSHQYFFYKSNKLNTFLSEAKKKITSYKLKQTVNLYQSKLRNHTILCLPLPQAIENAERVLANAIGIHFRLSLRVDNMGHIGR